jgi:hypothetical protein
MLVGVAVGESNGTAGVGNGVAVGVGLRSRVSEVVNAEITPSGKLPDTRVGSGVGVGDGIGVEVGGTAVFVAVGGSGVGVAVKTGEAVGKGVGVGVGGAGIDVAVGTSTVGDGRVVGLGALSVAVGTGVFVPPEVQAVAVIATAKTMPSKNGLRRKNLVVCGFTENDDTGSPKVRQRRIISLFDRFTERIKISTGS